MLRYTLLPALLMVATSARSTRLEHFTDLRSATIERSGIGSASARARDAAMRVDFTITGGGHQNERVQIRDVYPDIQAPFARFYESGIMFGVDKPILELRAGKTGPKLWAVHLILQNTGGSGPMGLVSSEPTVIFNGDNTARQQSWFPMIVLPPVKRGTLSVTLLSGGPAKRVRGTFAGTLVDDKGEEVTIGNGSFDLARLADM